jgi:hypothetical protein
LLITLFVMSVLQIETRSDISSFSPCKIVMSPFFYHEIIYSLCWLKAAGPGTLGCVTARCVNSDVIAYSPPSTPLAGLLLPRQCGSLRVCTARCYSNLIQDKQHSPPSTPLARLLFM